MSRLFGFRGRLGRSAFIALSMSAFGFVALSMPLLILASISQGVYGSGGLRGPGLLIVPVGLIALWSLLAQYAKRLHDVDKSAWHLAWICALALASVSLPPFVSPLAVIGPYVWLCVASGTEGPNRFGLEPSAAAVRPSPPQA